MSQDNSNNTTSSLSRTLRSSLEEVLREVSFEGNRLSGMGAPVAATAPRNSLLQNNLSFSAFKMPSFGAAASLPASSVSIPASSSTTSAFAALGGVPTLRPSEALGLSTEELMLAAATEKRMMEQTQRLLSRQTSLAEKTLQSRRLYQESLLALMKGTPNNNTNTPCFPTTNSVAGILGGGFGNGLLQQGFLQQFAKQAPSTVGSLSAPINIPAVPPLADSQTKTAIKVLGTSLRKKDSPYLDISALQDPDISDKRTRGGVTEPFPEKLHRMLEEVKKEGKDDIISFFSHGRAFAVHDPDRFVSEVMPKYFKQSRLSSFQRQLNLYGFTRITSGPDAGGYYHELFLQGRPNLAVHMRRVGLPQGEDRRKMRAKNMRSEPNFYAMGNVKDAQVRIPGL